MTPPPPASNVPDYPDPRTFTVGIFYWLTGPGSQPGLLTGRGATDFETLKNLGKEHKTPGVEVSLPVTRTGSLHFEAFETKGTGNQTALVATDLFSTTINSGDQLATKYTIRDFKLYLDDLLFPHRFPVNRFRLKSLWEIEYLSIHSNINAPLVTAGETADGSSNVILPVFGIAAEYALTRHILFRVDGAGVSDFITAPTCGMLRPPLTWRINRVEIVGGVKELHFKSSPKSAEYQIGTLEGAYVGARWHF